MLGDAENVQLMINMVMQLLNKAVAVLAAALVASVAVLAALKTSSVKCLVADLAEVVAVNV